MGFDPKFVAGWLALGGAVALGASLALGRLMPVPFRPLFIGCVGAWLAGGWIALKMINKEDHK